MTRINCVPVEELNKAMAWAEFRELPRLRHLKPRKDLPDTYRMGKGHVLFFLDKGKYLINRHKQLYDRLINHFKYRNISIPLLDLSHWPEWALNDWIPSELDININRQRINDRLNFSAIINNS